MEHVSPWLIYVIGFTGKLHNLLVTMLIFCGLGVLLTCVLADGNNDWGRGIKMLKRIVFAMIVLAILVVLLPSRSTLVAMLNLK